MIHEFRLSPPGSRNGVSCDADGAFVGTIPLLKRTDAPGGDQWGPRDCDELSDEISKQFGLPIDFSSKAGGIKAISNALNDGNLARAQIATVLLGVPDAPALSKGACSRDEMIKFVRDLYWSGLIALDDAFTSERPPFAVASDSPSLLRAQGVLTKAGYNPNELRGYHERWAREGSESATPSTKRPSGPESSSSGAVASQTNAILNGQKGSSQPFGSDLWREAQSALSEIGQANIAEGNASLAVGNATAHTVAGALRDIASYATKPWFRPDGPRAEVSDIMTGDANSDQGAVIAHMILEPNAPLAHPGTNADWMAALIGLASVGATVARPSVRPAGSEPMVAPERSAPAINRPFITLRAKLSADFDASQPIGKFEARDDLSHVDFGNYAHDQIGRLLQEAAGRHIDLTLNTDPYARGVDITVPNEGVDVVGFEHAEIKPLSRTGRSRFNNQVLNTWNLEGRVQAITYDRNGNIYYGFPGYDEP